MTSVAAPAPDRPIRLLVIDRPDDLLPVVEGWAGAAALVTVERSSDCRSAIQRINDLRLPPVDLCVAVLDDPIAAFTELQAEVGDLPVVVVTDGRSSAVGRSLVRAGAAEFVHRNEVDDGGLAWAILTAFDRQEHHRLAAAERSQRVLLEERRRIARELHDQVIQRLFAMGLELERLAILPADDGTRLRQLARSVDAAIDDLRFAVEQLRSGDQPIALHQTLERVAAEVGRSSTRRVLLDMTPSPTRIEPALAQAIVAVFREALTNAVKYGIGDIYATVTAGDDFVIEVAAGVPDDAPATPAGHGLRNMRDRAARYGGGMDFSIDPNLGSRLHWWVPLGPVDLHHVADLHLGSIA